MSSPGNPKAPSARPGGVGSPSLPPPRPSRPTPPPPIPRTASGSRPSGLPPVPAPGYTPARAVASVPPQSRGAAEIAPWDEVNLKPTREITPPSQARFPSAEAEYHAYKETPPPQFGYEPPPGYGSTSPYGTPASFVAPPAYEPAAYASPAPMSAYPASTTEPVAPGMQWTSRAPSPDSLLGRTAAKAQRAGADPYGTETVSTAHIDTLRKRARTGWLMAFLGFAALGAVLWFGYEERQKLLAQQAKQREVLTQAEMRVQAADKARIEAERSVAAVQEEASAKDTASTEDQKLIGDLKSMLTTKEGEIEAAGKTVSVSLVDDVMFPSGRSELALPGFRVLARVGKLLKDATDRQIVIGGHTDDRPLKKKGGFETNWELSAARAVNVVRYLVEEVGVDPSRVSAAAYSQYKPRSKNLAKNRRIEVLLTPMIKVKPQPKAKDAAPPKP